MNLKKHIRKILLCCEGYALREDILRAELETALRGRIGDAKFESSLRELLDQGQISRRQDVDTHDWLYQITETGKNLETR